VDRAITMPQISKRQEKLIADNQTVTILKNRMILRENKSIQTFTRYLDGVESVTEFLKVNKPDEALQVLANTTDRTGKLDEFIDYLLAKGTKPLNLKSQWFGVKKWLVANRINNIEYEFLTRPKATSYIQDRIPTKDELRRILGNKVTLRDKAFYILCLAAGFRFGTALSLQVKDYKPIEDLGMLTVHGGEGRKLAEGKVYITFLTPEARKLLEEYLQNRGTLNPEDPLFVKENTGTQGKKFEYTTNVSRQWTILLKRAKLAEKIPNSRSYVLHGHVLRKYFQTNCKLAGCNSGFVDNWMGHHPTKQDEYLNDSYFRPELEKSIKEYRKAIQALTIFDMGIDAEKLSTLEKNLQDKDKQIEEQNAKITNMENQFKEFVRKLEDGELHVITNKVKKSKHLQ
jgi:integrase